MTAAYLKRFYFTIDLRSLALYRIFLASLLIRDWFERWPSLEAFYTSFGILPIESPLGKWGGAFHYSLMDGANSLPMVQVMFVLTLICYVMFLIGWKTKFWQILSFLFYISITNRNQMVRDGSDVAMMTFSLWALFLPLGKRFSLDAIIARMKQGVDLRGRPSEPDEQNCAPSLAAFAIVWQIAMIYFLTVTAKYGDTWRNGTALYYAWNVDYMVRPLGLWLAHSLPLWMIKALTWSVVVIEYLAVPLILAPLAQPLLRRLAIVALVAMHLGIWCTMDIGHFPFVMIGVYPLLLVAADWELIRRWALRWSRTITVYYDDTCGFCHACCQLLAMADRARNIRFIGTSDKESFAHQIPQAEVDSTVVVFDDASQHKETKATAVSAILGALPLPFHLLRLVSLPGVRIPSDWGYDLISRNRFRISRWLGFGACGINRVQDSVLPSASASAPPIVRVWQGMLRAVATVIAGLIFVGIFSDNYNYNLAPTFNLPGIPERQLTRAIVDWVQIGFVWHLFAPDPLREDGWWVIDGVTESGKAFDPLTGKAPTWEKPRDLAARYDRFWRKALEFISIKYNDKFRLDFARYIAGKNHREKPQGERLVRFKLYYVLEYTLPPGSREPFPTERIVLWQHECFVNPPAR